MPFATQPRPRVTATGQACRAIVATRLQAPELEHAVFRALQFGWFTTPLVMEDHDDLAVALSRVDGLDVDAIVGAIGSDEVEAAYQADRAEARTAEGTPTEAQGKAARPTAQVRYTAPSLIFEHDGPAARGRRLPAHRGLRRRARQPRPAARAHAAAAGSARGARGVRVRADHLRGRGGHEPRQERAGPRERRARADRARRRGPRHPRVAGGRGAVARAASARSDPGRTASGQAAAAPR